jgi:hypothetical protein
LFKIYGDKRVSWLPENSCFTDGFFKGLPRICLELHARTPASPYDVMNAWRDGVSPRHVLHLCVDLKPGPVWEGTRKKCWVDLDKVFGHPLMQKVNTLSVAFGNTRSDTALGMAGRFDVIRAIVRSVDPKRTPYLGFYEASFRTRRAAERELDGFGRLYVSADRK